MRTGRAPARRAKGGTRNIGDSVETHHLDHGRLAAQFHWPTLIRADVIAIAVVFSGLVGVVFGLYPARQASRLDPIDALRFE
jgi:ABC-type antimicrobial peptide transport system permease subunit